MLIGGMPQRCHHYIMLIIKKNCVILYNAVVGLLHVLSVTFLDTEPLL